MICIIASRYKQAEHYAHLLRLPKDGWTFISPDRPYKLYDRGDLANIIFAPEWFRGHAPGDVDLVEALVRQHDEQYKRGPRP